MKQNVRYYLIGNEEFKVTYEGEYLIIERKVGEWIHDFPPKPPEELYEYVCMIKREHIPLLKKLLEKLVR